MHHVMVLMVLWMGEETGERETIVKIIADDFLVRETRLFLFLLLYYLIAQVGEFF